MSNSVLWYTTRGAGAVSLILLTCVVVLGVLSALRVQSQSWPRFLTTGLHRNLALMTLVFLALHIVTAVVDPFTNLGWTAALRSEEHTSELQSPCNLVCRLLLEKKKKK